MNISVAIVTRNRPESLRQTLASLVSQTKKPKEVLVVDNASNSKLTRQVVLQFTHSLPVRYIVERKIGIPFARNKALQEAKYKFLAFLDDDCETSSSWIENIEKSFIRFPNAAAVLGITFSKPKNSIIAQATQFLYQRWIGSAKVSASRVGILDTKNIGLNLKLLKKAGVKFDESFKRSSDVDLGNQLISKGQAIFFDPSIVMYHWEKNSLVGFLRKRFVMGQARSQRDRKWKGKYLPQYDNKNLKHQASLMILLIVSLGIKVFDLGRFFEDFAFFYNRRRLLESKTETVKASQNLKLDIIIITKNRPQSLRRCLNSLIRQKKGIGQVIVVDSSTNLNTKLLMRKFRKKLPITYIFEKKEGFGPARNRGVGIVKSEIFAFIDDDEKASHNWVKNIIETHESASDVVAIQGRIESLPTSSVITLVERLRIDRWFLNSLDLNNGFFTICTKNASFKTGLFRKLGLKFREDQQFGKFGSEDVDIGQQIISLNQKIIYQPKILTFHWERQTVWAYLQQQYRKGYSKRLIEKNWGYSPVSLYKCPIPYFFNPLIELLFYPKANFLYKIAAIPLFYLSLFVYMQGWRRGEYIKSISDKPQLVPNRSHSKEISVAIVTKDRAAFLQKALESVQNQTILPYEIIVVDNNSKDETKLVVQAFQDSLNIKYCKERKIGIPYARNRALDMVKTPFLAFLDDDCKANKDWLEKLLEAHRSHPNVSAIQGFSKSFPTKGIFALIAQFNRQTWIRDNMIGDRSLYWDWIAGRINRNFEVLSCDTRNLSLKMEDVRREKISFDTKIMRGSDADFAKRILLRNQHIILYPKAQVEHIERSRITDFLKQRFYQGQTAVKVRLKWPEEYHSRITRSSAYSIAAFVYYCIKNRLLIKLPVLTAVFIMQLIFFNWGKTLERRLHLKS